MRIAVVTGVSQGLGLEIANLFVKNDWQVLGIGRSERPSELDSSIDYHRFDASDVQVCAEFWQKIAKKFKKNEICLVNNAGSFVSGNLIETNSEDYVKLMHSNYFTGVNMTREMTKVIPKAKIINIISNGALSAKPNISAYGAAKAAAMYFFQSLQKEIGAEKYRITNLYPSNIATSSVNPDEIDPADIASFVLQQADNESSYYVTDVTLFPSKGKKD